MRASKLRLKTCNLAMAASGMPNIWAASFVKARIGCGGNCRSACVSAGASAAQANRASRHGQQCERGDEQVCRAVPARERLQREEQQREPQVPCPSFVEIGVHVGETEGQPVNRRELELLDAEKARRREGEDQAGEDRGRLALATARFDLQLCGERTAARFERLEKMVAAKTFSVA